VDLRKGTVDNFLGGVGALIGDIKGDKECRAQALLKVGYQLWSAQCTVPQIFKLHPMR